MRLLPPVQAGLAALYIGGCRGPGPAAEGWPAIPATVLVRADRSGEDRPPLDLDLLEREVVRALAEGRVFSGAVAAGDTRYGRSGLRADYTLELEVLGSGIEVEESDANARAVLSTFLWLILAFPAWWIDDRSYPGADVEVRARLFSSGAGPTGTVPPARPILAGEFRPPELELDLIRRGAPWHFLLSLLVPPFWMEDPAAAALALEDEAIRLAAEDLAEGLRNDWPAAAFRGEPACLLHLDPDPGALQVWDGRVDLRAWIAARKPVIELRLFGEDGRVLSRLDRSALEGLVVEAEDLEAGHSFPEWFERARTGRGTGGGSPQGRLYRLQIDGLEIGASPRLRIEAWTAPRGVPARFTLPCAR